MSRSTLSLPFALLGLSCASEQPPVCPEPAPAIRVPDAATPVTPEAPPSQADTTPTSTSNPRPIAGFPIPSNCQAQLSVTQEITRMLHAAAAHGTRSAACVDGPGQRLAVNDILVCPAAPDGDDVVVQVFYELVTYREGDTRGCSRGQDCSWLDPSATEHLIELRLRRSAKDPKRGTLVDPGPLPGFPDDATPLGEAHQGNCYGESPAHVFHEVKVSR